MPRLPRVLIAAVCLFAQVAVALTPPGLALCLGCPPPAQAAPGCCACCDTEPEAPSCCTPRSNGPGVSRTGSCCMQIPAPIDQQRPEPRQDNQGQSRDLFPPPVAIALMPGAQVAPIGGAMIPRWHPPPPDLVILTGRLLL